MPLSTRLVFSYFYTPPPPSIHPLSLHDALPIFFSSLDASGTHWNSKSTPLCSFRAVMIGPEASGVVGVCSIDIQVSVPPSPAEPPPPPELPQEARAPAPAMPAAARGRDFRRVLRWIMRGPFVVEKQGGAGVQVGAGVGVREWTRRRR